MAQLHTDTIGIVISYLDHTTIEALSQANSAMRQAIADVYVPTRADIEPIISNRCGFLLKQIRRVTQFHPSLLFQHAVRCSKPISALRHMKSQLGLCITKCANWQVRAAIKHTNILLYMMDELGADVAAIIASRPTIITSLNVDDAHIIRLLDDSRVKDKLHLVVNEFLMQSKYAIQIFKRCDWSKVDAPSLYDVLFVNADICTAVVTNPTFKFDERRAFKLVLHATEQSIKECMPRVLEAPVSAATKLAYALALRKPEPAMQYIGQLNDGIDYVLWSLIADLTLKWNDDAIILALLGTAEFGKYAFVEHVIRMRGLENCNILIGFMAARPDICDDAIIYGGADIVWWTIKHAKSDLKHLATVLLDNRPKLAEQLKQRAAVKDE